MQAAVFSVSQPLPVLLPAKTLGSPWKPAPRLAASPRLPRLRAMTIPPDSSSTVDYSSVTSVFPAEACETIGGEACSVNMYPEVKLSPDEDKKNPPRSASEDIDREYYDYNSPKTYAISTKKSYSYVLQLAISLGQLYGIAVYFVTAVLEGDNFAASPLYYYLYYALMNSFWILIPTIISIRCWKKICAALQFQAQNQKKSKISIGSIIFICLMKNFSALALDLHGLWKHSKSDGREDYGLLINEKAKKYAIVKELDEYYSLKDGLLFCNMRFGYKMALNVETISDPDDKKPEDWDERAKIPDPDAMKPDDWDEDTPMEIEDDEAVKPEDWLDDDPEEIDEPEAAKPEDWDNEEDGEWEAPKTDYPIV
ncbi:hypothetical protein SAY86_020002 [Trapa natans]|uniref:EXPERA domain-containing protein n=1 Tax=Trapa natans TaxID=22666 RepID=A0AAN7LIB3_TRANT|nr:hypothetical protein SAY86_020002 [Trapa natans]